MKNKFGLLLLWLMHLTLEVLTILTMASLLANGRVILAVITIFGVHYYALKTDKTLDRLINSFEQ